MKKKILILMAGAALLFALVPNSFAAAKIIESVVNQENDGNRFPNEPVAVRYFLEGDARISPGGPGRCAGAAHTWIEEGRYCEERWRSNATTDAIGYLGFADNITNWDGNFGVYQAAWDAETGTGGADHAGYYAWMAKDVQLADNADRWVGDCQSGPNDQSCVGSANPVNAAGTDVPNTPLGTLSPIGGLRPIPVPLPSDVSGDVITLEWEPATKIGSGATADIQYDLYYVVKDGSCAAPTAAEYTNFLKTVTGVTTTVNTADLGFGAGEDKAVFFAMKLRYPNTATDVVTRYFSANSQCIAFGTFGVEIAELQARHLGGTAVEVSWRTELEDGVVGFYVTRALAPEGPYTRVSPLLSANGEPSGYSFVDRINLRRVSNVKGLFYQLEAIDVDDEITTAGPAEASIELPSNIQTRPTRQQRPLRRR